MAINVTCPSCLKRFTVADEHAGKTGPCPKCKKPITIPKAEEGVVIHAPKPDGPVDKEGKEVLKTAKRKDAAFDPLVATGVSIIALLTLVAAFMLRGSVEDRFFPILGGAYLLLGPLVAWAGYGFLREAEIEPHRGATLWLRAAICGAVFALCWFIYYYLADQMAEEFWREEGLAGWQVFVAIAAAIGIGSFGAFASLDLDAVMAFFLCALYFIITVLLRVVMALPALPGFMTDGG